ncbi:MAG: class I mannose-6-phosphate isomerase [Rubricoccaceae bacterium]|nr:class I mannose-6-phosphate isomerase [Rubricoccaceae bacterium]
MSVTESTPALYPADATDFPRGRFDPFPAFPLSEGTIEAGYDALAERVAAAVPEGLRVLALDGFHGVDWDRLRAGLDEALRARGVEADWWPAADALADADVIAERIAPFLGGDDPIFGTHFPLGPDVFFDAGRLAALRIEAAVARGRAAGRLALVYGVGAALVELSDARWSADLPKDRLQERAREEGLTNLGTRERLPFNLFYKRAYFVEWPALNRHKQRLLPHLDRFLDLTDADRPTALTGDAFRAALHELSETPFRPRPWFYPGPWGGRFMQGHMGLDPEQPNFAWSFELITPENGIALDAGGERLECSFDCLMFQEHRRVLGDAARQFRYEWPLRLDYLDTISGGNLSVQCHPRPDVIRRAFGETFTQDETYYISAAQEDAVVYLGLHDGADEHAFRDALEASAESGEPVDFERYVHSVPAKPHDLFLIPNGTLHCSGRGNLVLEISATPYIFTFKLYDYARRDLEGKLRPINLERAWESLRFERRGAWVRENLVATPEVIREGDGWQEERLMARPEFFYSIHRLTLAGAVDYALENRALAINLVDGEAVEVVAENGRRMPLRYLESMVVPAATGHVRFENRGEGPCRLVLVFVRPGVGATLPLNDPIA